MEVVDFVHGTISVPEWVAKIVETPHFQRLKEIKQLGLLYKELPMAVYTRYDHSIGTYYLASKMLTSLEKNSDWFKYLSTNRNDLQQYKLFRQAVEVAALLHDIGHGPFSHLWERIVSDYNHEESSIHCVEDIFETVGPDVLPELRLNNNYGIYLIKALILGDFNYMPSSVPIKYRFLFEIVHNKQCELDVDKLDYLKRDFYCAKFILIDFEEFGTEMDNIFFEARINESGEHIEYRFQDYESIYKLFESRHRLHIKFYRMPKIMALDYLLKEIILNEEFEIDGKPVTKIRSRPIETFLKLVDNEILRIVCNHKLFPYLTNTKRIQEIDAHTTQSKEWFVFDVHVNIQGAGTDMPPDESFNFYGNQKLKGTIKRDMETKTLSKSFRLM